jgi:glucose-1-phosphate adenylyltransferase
VRVHGGALVEDSIILDNCEVGRCARIRRAILDEHAAAPDGATIGYDLENDRRLYHVTESGIVVLEGHSAIEMWTH